MLFNDPERRRSLAAFPDIIRHFVTRNFSFAPNELNDKTEIVQERNSTAQ